MAIIQYFRENPNAEYFGDMRLFKKSPKAPPAPDPSATASAQAQMNKETALWNAALNNVNQITPYGTLNYTQTGGKVDPNMPQFTSTINLSPEAKKLLDTQLRSENALSGLGEEQIARIRANVSSPYSYDSLGDAPTAQSVEQLSQQGQEAIMARLNPQFSYDEEAMRTRLINQGIGQGSEAYRREMEAFNQMKNDARTQALLSGASYGGTLQDQALRRRNQAIGEYSTVRNAPLNEYTAMTSGIQVQNPQFQSPNYTGAPPVDYAGLVNQGYQNQLAQYNARQAGRNSTMGGIFSLGGSVLGAAGNAGGFGSLFSDARVKENIVFAGIENGYNLYDFNYTWDDTKRYRGVMAQDVLLVDPEAVSEIDGVLAVNYDRIGVRMTEVRNG